MNNPRLMGLTLVLPWEEVSESVAARVAAELEREVGPGHPLLGRAVHVLAGRVDCDDFLVEAPGLSRPYAVVHLTWTGQREENPTWPETTLFISLQHWAEEGMKADHLDYTDDEPVS